MSVDVAAVVARYLQRLPGERDKLAPLLERLRAPADLFARSAMAGHVTGSGFVLDPSGSRTLLIRHAVLGRWFQPGGHVEADESPAQGAAREVREETGLASARPVDWAGDAAVPVDIDPHRIPANPRKGESEHWHFDFRYLFVADPAAPLEAQEDEVGGARWVALADVPALVDEPALVAALEKARRALAARG